MVTAFQKPSRTKSLFAQVDAGRPAVARQKLGGIESSQSVLKNQTGAQQGENNMVSAAQGQVAANTRQTYDKLDGFAKVDQRLDSQEKFAAGAVPVFASKVGTSATSPVMVTGQAGKQTVTADNAFAGNVDRDQKVVQGSNVAAQSSYANEGNALTGMTTEGLAEELSGAYKTDTMNLDVAQRQMSDGNLGVLANESAFEQEQAQLAQVLADRQSNVGKLRALYGGGYDSSKYGALDSNLLQGQFNDAQVEATSNIEDKKAAQLSGARVRESYLDQVDKSKKQTDEAKGVADKRIGEMSSELARLDGVINKAISDSGGRLNTATAALISDRDKLKGDYQKAINAKQNEAGVANQKFKADEIAAAKKEEEERKKRESALAKLDPTNPLASVFGDKNFMAQLDKQGKQVTAAGFKSAAEVGDVMGRIANGTDTDADKKRMAALVATMGYSEAGKAFLAMGKQAGKQALEGVKKVGDWAGDKASDAIKSVGIKRPW